MDNVKLLKELSKKIDTMIFEEDRSEDFSDGLRAAKKLIEDTIKEVKKNG